MQEPSQHAIEFARACSSLHICRILAQALPLFQERTGINAQMIFAYDKAGHGLEVSMGFQPRQPEEDEFNILLDEILEAEKLLMAQETIQEASTVETLEQLVFRMRENGKQIIDGRNRRKAENA